MNVQTTVEYDETLLQFKILLERISLEVSFRRLSLLFILRRQSQHVRECA